MLKTCSQPTLEIIALSLENLQTHIPTRLVNVSNNPYIIHRTPQLRLDRDEATD